MAPIMTAQPRQCSPRMGGNGAKLSQVGRQGMAIHNAVRCVPGGYMNYRRKLQRDTLAKRMMRMLPFSIDPKEHNISATKHDLYNQITDAKREMCEGQSTNNALANQYIVKLKT